MLSQHEVWKDYTGSIEPFHGLIRVSNMGRIFKKGTNTSKNQSGILKGTYTNQGYVKIHVSINGEPYVQFVHRLVAETFVSNPDPEHKNILTILMQFVMIIVLAIYSG